MSQRIIVWSREPVSIRLPSSLTLMPRDLAAVTLERSDRFTGIHVPHPDGLVRSGAEQPAAIARAADALQGARVSGEGLNRMSVFEAPSDQLPTDPAAIQARAIRADADTPDPPQVVGPVERLANSRFHDASVPERPRLTRTLRSVLTTMLASSSKNRSSDVNERTVSPVSTFDTTIVPSSDALTASWPSLEIHRLSDLVPVRLHPAHGCWRIRRPERDRSIVSANEHTLALWVEAGAANRLAAERGEHGPRREAPGIRQWCFVHNPCQGTSTVAAERTDEDGNRSPPN